MLSQKPATVRVCAAPKAIDQMSEYSSFIGSTAHIIYLQHTIHHAYTFIPPYLQLGDVTAANVQHELLRDSTEVQNANTKPPCNGNGRRMNKSSIYVLQVMVVGFTELNSGVDTVQTLQMSSRTVWQCEARNKRNNS